MSGSEPTPTRELTRLMAELIDGSLDETSRESLREELKHPGQTEAYRRLMMVHAMLIRDLKRGRSEPTTPLASTSMDHPLTSVYRSGSGSSGIRARLGRLLFPAVAVALAASLAVGVWLGGTMAPRRPANGGALKRSLADGRGSTITGVAVLAREVDAKGLRTPHGERVQVGTPLAAGKYQLDRGLIQLEFFSGATVVLEAPTRFSLMSADKMVVDQGKARAHVPTQAVGFTIETPQHDVVDLGTEFAVAVDAAGDSEIHVLDGEIELHDRAGAQSQPLSLIQGQAMASASGQLTPVAFRHTNFIGQRDIHDASLASSAGSRAAWAEYSNGLRSREDVLAYYAFDNHSDWDRVLRNEGPVEDDRLDGAIVGCEWAEGRWPGKRALCFKRSSDRIRVNVPGEFESLTLVTWARIEGFDRWLSSLVLTDGHQLGEVHWQLSNEGQLLLGVKAEAEKSHDFFSPPCLDADDLGRWIHIACVYDGEAGTVSHFLDGKLVSEEPITLPTPLRIGDAQIGNWDPEVHKVHSLRSLNGRIDELLLFSTPLSADELRKMYEVGRPF